MSVPSAFRLSCGSRTLDLSTPQVMGILNVTPDSFSDGGRYNQLDKALYHAEAMLAAGASMIDVGGESTRPGAAAVSTAEELARVAPVVEAMAQRLDVVISLDTSTPEVIIECARLGAGLINDVRALQRSGALDAAVQVGLPVCLMHMQGTPQNMQGAPSYQNVVQEVEAFLVRRRAECIAAGIPASNIVFDPGFGFGKTLEHNLQLFQSLESLHHLGQPLLVGVSRKSMIGQVLGRDSGERLVGSLALAALAVSKGAQILRVHDVPETMDVVRMITAVQSA